MAPSNLPLRAVLVALLLALAAPRVTLALGAGADVAVAPADNAVADTAVPVRALWRAAALHGDARRGLPAPGRAARLNRNFRAFRADAFFHVLTRDRAAGDAHAHRRRRGACRHAAGGARRGGSGARRAGGCSCC